MSAGTDELLTAFEECRRKAFWMREWESTKLTATQMLQIGVRTGLTEPTKKDWGLAAGEALYSLGANHGLVSKQLNIHDEIVHLSAIAEAVATVLRKDAPWKPPETVEIGNGHAWSSDVLLDPSGARLRRIVFASSWNDDRHYSLCRSWGSLGSVCVHNLPLQIGVVLLGAHKDGKFHSCWSKAYSHPVNRQIRFRRRNNVSEGFKSTWGQIWREDHGEFSTQDWLQAMLDDSVLQDALLVVDLPVPEKVARQRILDIAARRLDEIWATKELPDQQLSTCDWPQPCGFRSNCHSGNQPSGRYGFVPVSSLSTSG